MFSAVILTKNEEANIKECIERLKWCDEIVVIDDFSKDNTAKIAESSGAKVVKHKLNDSFADQRNFALEHVSGKWIFFVDADERVSYELRVEITKVVKDISLKAFAIPRVDYFMNKKLRFGDTADASFVRLVRKGTGKWVGRVHEVWVSEGRVGALKNHIRHYPHPTIVEFLRSINLYSSLRAKELHEQGKKTNVFEICIFPLGKFIFLWIFKLGFLDGTVGIIHAIMMSFHSFLVRAKLYLLWKGISGYPLPDYS